MEHLFYVYFALLRCFAGEGTTEHRTHRSTPEVCTALGYASSKGTASAPLELPPGIPHGNTAYS